MEISKSLQEEIVAVQNKLKNAIRDHQICVAKLKDDPNNTDIRGQIQKIQSHIVSLGRCQKQVVQRLRKEVEAFKADNANGSKVSIASLLGLNNNNHITNNNETKHETASNGFETKPSKENYEEVVRNGDVPSPDQDNNSSNQRSNSVETISGEDDVIEVSMDENSNEKQEETQIECKVESPEKLSFLHTLGLITMLRYTELQNKRAERKRRSTANPHFVYSFLEQPAKRKRHSYLQSVGNAPHTRQTTARMNGPSPPPNKSLPTKSTSPPVRTATKSLIPIQKSTARPNILRNAVDSKVFVNRSKVEDNQMRVSTIRPSAKSVQSVGSKAVHIPGLPSSLTIERIGNDSIVCISCRNPGTLAVCENCSGNYHVSCHSRSPAPPRTCPKCAMITDKREDLEEDEEEGRQGRVKLEDRLPRYKKDEGLEEKERERYELRERNSDLRLQVYELEKRSQLLGQSLQLQQRMRQELLGKQEKTQRSIKRLVDFIKLMQLRKSVPSPTPSASTSCLPRPSSSQSPQTIPLPQTSTSQRISRLPRSLMSNNDKISYLATPSSSTSNLDRTSPTSKQTIRWPSPISCQAPVSNQKSINHTSSLRKSPNQPDDPIALFEVKSRNKTVPQISTVNCRLRQVTALPSRPASSSPIPSSSVVTVKNKPTAQSQRSTVLSIRKSSSPSRTSITSTAGSPGTNSHAVNSVSSSPSSQPPKSYCHPISIHCTTTLRATNSCRSQSQADHQRKHRPSTVVANTNQEQALLSTHCSQAITSPISSPIVHANHEAAARTTETIRSSDSICAARSMNWSRTSSQTSQQYPTFSGAPSRGSSST